MKAPRKAPARKAPARKAPAPKAPVAADDPARTLAACLAKFDPQVAAVATSCLERLRALVPGAKELVYDAYNALAIPFGTGERLGDTFVGITVYPRHVNLNFLRGSELEDPDGLLVGTGSKIRHPGRGRRDAPGRARPAPRARGRDSRGLPCRR